MTAFTSYVAESRARGTTWTMISEGALYEAERHRQALGDITPITREYLWQRAAEDMSEKPYKGLGIDLLASAQRDREQAIDIFIAASHHMERAQLADPDAGLKAFQRLRAAAVNDNLGRLLAGLDHAVAENGQILHDIQHEREAALHLRAMRAEVAAAGRHLDAAGANKASGPSV